MVTQQSIWHTCASVAYQGKATDKYGVQGVCVCVCVCVCVYVCVYECEHVYWNCELACRH